MINHSTGHKLTYITKITGNILPLHHRHGYIWQHGLFISAWADTEQTGGCQVSAHSNIKALVRGEIFSLSTHTQRTHNVLCFLSFRVEAILAGGEQLQSVGTDHHHHTHCSGRGVARTVATYHGQL